MEGDAEEADLGLELLYNIPPRSAPAPRSKSTRGNPAKLSFGLGLKATGQKRKPNDIGKFRCQTSDFPTARRAVFGLRAASRSGKLALRVLEALGLNPARIASAMFVRDCHRGA